MNDHDQLTNVLRDHADRVGNEHPLGLDDVKGRARSIRRRQVATSGLAAAAVLAIAVPAGFAISDRTRSADSAPAATPSVDVTPSGDPTVANGTPVRLTTDAPADDTVVGIPYLLRGSLRLTETIAVDVEDVVGSGPYAATVVDDDVLVMGYGVDSLLIARVGGSGTVKDSWDSFGGAPVPSWLSDVRQLLGGQIVGIGPGVDTPESPPGGPSDLGGVAADGRYSQVVSRSDTGSCSAVFSSPGEELWRTCDYTLSIFSPDSQYVVGRPTYLDGLGDAYVAILDANTGEVMVSFERGNGMEDRDLFLDGRYAWDSDGSLLAQAWDEGRWHLLRLGVDGEISRVDAFDLSTDRDETDPPLALAVN